MLSVFITVKNISFSLQISMEKCYYEQIPVFIRIYNIKFSKMSSQLWDDAVSMSKEVGK